MKVVLLLLTWMITTASMVFGQSEELYRIRPESLNMRSGPGTNFDVIIKLPKGSEVSVTSKELGDWWGVAYNNINGFVHSDYLELNNDPFRDWIPKKHDTGATPECFNIIPKYDYEIDNMLRVRVGSNTDVAIKLMNQVAGTRDVCIRIVYINSGDTYEIKNIPEGIYYLKIAYGVDWRQSVEHGQCIGKFVKHALYEIGEEQLDYNLKDMGEYYSVPYFELDLDVIWTEIEDEFKTDRITEEEFNE